MDQNESEFFSEPTPVEMHFIRKIYEIKHFQASLSQRKLLSGGPYSDPFVIAKAKIESATVVTSEKSAPNFAKIPNICKHFDVLCCGFDDFLRKEQWKFLRMLKKYTNK